MSKQTPINTPGTEKVYEKLQFSQAVGVRELAFPQLLVEIKATAVIGSGQK